MENADVQAKSRLRWLQYDSLRTHDQLTHIESVTNRLERLLGAAFMEQMVGSSETTVPFDKILSGTSLLIISLSPSNRKKKLVNDRFDLVGSMLLSEFTSRVFSREAQHGAKPDRVHVYIDEYERFATSITAELLTQGRKYGVGLTFAYQNLSQIRDETIRGAARGTGTLIVLRVSRPDADEVAGEFPIKPKPQSTEILPVLDGKKPIKLPTLIPGTHLVAKSHTTRLLRTPLADYSPMEIRARRIVKPAMQ
jgi:hypothetical protein